MLFETGADFEYFGAAGARECAHVYPLVLVAAVSADGRAVHQDVAVILTHVSLQGGNGGEGLVADAAEMGRHVLVFDVVRVDALLSAGTLPAVLGTVLRLLMVVVVLMVLVLVLVVGRLPAATDSAVTRQSHAVKRVERPEESGGRRAAGEPSRPVSGGRRGPVVVRAAAVFRLRGSPAAWGRRIR